MQVIEPGLLTTVQDLGREGFGPMGVSASGAADPIALRIGNRLVGNPENAAGLEMTLRGGAFLFPKGGVVALTGSDFGAPLWTAIEMRAGETLRLGATQTGARCYLCVRGGIVVEPFLGSASTHVLSGLGGRLLRAGDVLRIGPATGAMRTVSAQVLDQLAPRKVLRVTPGPQSDWFSGLTGAYRVTEDANRMGLRLEGEPIPAPAREMITEGVSLGAIQVPPGGQPIILFVEQQTTGGYPKIANVISADLHSLGQLRPRDEIRFEQVSFETARALLREQEELIASLG
jgi:biotin-dependent carboxylase-like uncharacterized protein